MFSDLEQLLKDEKYFSEIPVRDLGSSCCTALDIPVVPFITIKDKFCGIAGKTTPPSVNGLFFDKNKKLYFLQTSQYYVNSDAYPLENFFGWIQSRDIDTKRDGTLSVLSDMVSHYKKADNFESFFQISVRDKIKTIVLTDLSNQDFLKIRLATMDKLSLASSHPVLAQTIIATCESFHEAFQ